MSVVNKQIAAVEFQADARQANQAIESMRLEADKCNKKVELLQERLSKGIKTIKIEGRDTDVEKEIKNQQRLARSYNDAAAALMKGVKAWDELWKHYKTGDIEALTGQQIKSGINGAKRQYDRLLLGDEEDRKKALAIKAIVDEATVVLDKLKGSTNEVIQTLRDGGHVADEVLQREKKYLEDMLGLTEKFSPEWQDYNRQLQDVNKYIAQQAAEEKRLRGELVDANDARREAAKLNQQTADAAKKEHEAQQRIIDDAKTVLQQREDELRLHKENAQKKSEEIAQQDRLIDKQYEVVESVKRENREINKKSGALNKAAREADGVADSAKRAAEKSTGEVSKLALKLADAEGKVRDLQAQLDKLGNTRAQSKVETSSQSFSVDKERQRLTEKLNKVKQEQADLETQLNAKTQEAKRLSDESVKADGIAAAKRDELNKAQEEGNKRLTEESQKLSDLEAKRNEDVNALNKEKEAIKQTTDAANEQGKIIHDAQQKQAQNRQLSIDSIEKAIELLKQENRVIGDETNPQWVENEKTIGRLNQRLSEMKQHAAELRGEAMSVNEAMNVSQIVSGQRVREVEPVDSRVNRATAQTRGAISNIDTEINRVNSDMEKLNAKKDQIGSRSANLNPVVEKLRQSNALLQEQESHRQATADGFAKEAEQRQKAIAAQKEQVELLKSEKQAAVSSIDQRIQAIQARMAEMQGYSIKPKDYKQVVESIKDEIKKLEEEKAAINNSAESKERFAEANRKLARLIKEDSEATASEKAALEALDGKIAETQAEMNKLSTSIPGFNAEDIQHYAAELSKLNEELSKQKQQRNELQRTLTTEQAERNKVIQAQRDEIALMKRQKSEAISSIDARIEAGRKMLEQLNALPSEQRVNGPAKGMIDSAHQTIRELYAQRSDIIKSSDAKIELATEKYASLMKANEEATAKAQATLRQYDEQIQATQQKIADLTEKLSSIKGPVDAKELEESSKKMDELKDKLASLTAERQKYTEQLQRETEEATRLAEAEKAAAESEKGSISIERMEKAISVLQQAKRSTDDSVSASRYGQAIDTLTQKLKEARGEAVSLESALEMANTNNVQPYSIDEMQKGLKALQEQQNVAVDPSKYTEAIDVLTQKLREAKGEAVSLDDALNFGKQGLDGSFKGTTEQLRQAKQVLEQTLANTAKGPDKYKEIREALAGIAIEEKRVGEVSDKIQKILDQPKGRSFNELKMAVEQGRKALNDMGRATKEEQQAYDKLAEKVKAADLELKNVGNTSKGAASSFEKAVSRLKTYITLYMGTAVAIQKLTATMGDVMTLSDKMGEVRKTTGFTAEQVGELSNNLAKLDTRTPVQNLMELAATAGQLGLNTQEDVQGFTEAANMMLVALPEMGQDGAKQMMKIAIATGEVKKIQKQMQEGTIEGSSATAVAMEKIASTIDRLRATTAAAAPPIADFVKRVGAVGAQSGISVDQVAALGATVDSLGMGTEMAGTAIARMIPAIKNHAFDIAQAIGVTPETIRNMYESGKAMDVILMILQHIHDQNLNPDGIEKLLGSGGMAEIMKELGQQGARAGIVFAGLSQNVDELRKNLATANSAYQEGTAIMDEYNKMNDTTAGKWERLKNQVQEVFVGDANQRFLGGVIDLLRTIVNWLTGSNRLGAFLRTIITLIGLVKLEVASLAKGAVVALWNGLKNIAISLRIVKGEMTKLQMANIWTAIALAVAYLVYELSQLKSASDIANEELGKAQEKIARATERFEGYWHTLTEADVALRKATASHNRLSAEVDRLRNSTNKSSAATAALSKKEGELKNSEHAVTQATNNRRTAIANINAIYGKYLGFIITERNYSLLAASAHDQVTAAIKREMLMKEKQAAMTDIDSKYQSDIADNYGKLSEKLVSKGGLSRHEAAAAMAALQKYMRTHVKYDAGTNSSAIIDKAGDENDGFVQRLKRGGMNTSGLSVNQISALFLNDYLKRNTHMGIEQRRDITGIGVYRDAVSGKWTVKNRYSWKPGDTNARGGLAGTYADRETERGAVEQVFDSDIDYEGGVEQKAFTHNLNGLIKTANQAKNVIYNKKSSSKAVSNAYEDLANALEGLDNYKDNLDPRRDAKTLKQLDSFATSLRKDKRFDATRLKKAQQNLHQTYIDKATEDAGLGGGTGNISNVTNIPKIDPGATQNNPWGTNADAASTDWSKLNGKQLVERRKQMNDFVKSLQWDTDVESVLSEDPALQKVMKEGKVKKDTDSVIAWYNKQRLAIQDELHSRFLTNTGNWQDPKKAHQHAKSASKMAKDDMSYYLDELDAYYTERKSKIEEAQNDGEITEAEGWRRTLDNDRIWQQRRAELQELYANKSSKVTKDKQDAIFNILSERTGDNTDMIEAQIASTLKFIKAIGEKSEPAMRRIFGDLDLGVEQSFLKMRTAVKKQLEAINDIIDKERPFNGIVRNLETNISKMGLLIPDINKKLDALDAAGKSKSKEADALNEQAQYQNPKRLTFLLQESESAYQMTWQQFEADLRKNGFGDWADTIVNSDNAERDKEAILAQLRTVYDDVQDAIKKEASEVKKQVDIAWNDTVLPGGVSIKQSYERAANALGVEQGRVSRANSMIGAGTASERVADKLAIKQMEIQLQMQTHYYNLVRKTGEQRVADLKRQEEDARKRGDINKAEQLAIDAKHAKMSLNLTLSEEETDLAKQREEIIARTEESEAKLYASLKEWGNLFASSLQGLFEASNTGAADYYNNLAKMRLTGEGSGGGTYVIIDNAGTKDAKAHYETLDGEDALKRQLEIERQNAVADEWKKVMDDINKKISDQITDWMNAALQNQAMDANTYQLTKNTEALDKLTGAVNQKAAENGNNAPSVDNTLAGPDGVPEAIRRPEDEYSLPRALRKRMGLSVSNDAFDDTHVVESWQPEWQQQQPQQDGGSAFTPMPSFASEQTDYTTPWASYAEASTKATQTIVQNNKKQLQSTTDTHKKEKDSAKNTYSAMAAAMNMYGLAYQVMSNENMSSTQKFLTFALQSAGQVAIAMLTTNMLQTDAQSKIELPGILGKAASQLGPIAGPIAFAAMTALLGGLMAVATSKVSKSKSQISQVTGASVSAGRLSTGMLTYAEGNVNEFTDPSTLTPGQQYNVDAADGHTYRARYMGSNPTTHLTNGPEFHLVGERGREAIIDANTTRQLKMNDTGIWNAIQTLYNGGSVRSVRRSGMRNFTTGNLDDFADASAADMATADGAATETTGVVSSLQASLDRNSDVLERAMREGIKGVFDIHGKGGLVDSYDRGKKEANRHGEKY